MRSKHGRPREPSQEEEEEEAWRRGGWACHGVEDPPAERASHAPSALGGLCKAKANQFFRNPVARRSSFYINFALRSSLRRPFFFLRIFVPCNSLTFITKISKMKFFGRGKALATEVAVGGQSDSDNTSEKHNTSGVDADALERVPSQNVQDGVKKVEAVTLTWTRNQLILAYGWQELHSYRQS
jgi:hypothetical protein